MDTPRRRVSRKRAVSQEGKTPKKSRGGNRKPAEVLSPQDLNKTTVGNPRPLFASSPKKQQDKWLENSFVNNNIVPGTPQQTALNTSTQLLFSPDHIYSQTPPSPPCSDNEEDTSADTSDLLLGGPSNQPKDDLENKPVHRHNLRAHKPNKILEALKPKTPRSKQQNKAVPPCTSKGRGPVEKRGATPAKSRGALEKPVPPVVPASLGSSSRCLPVSRIFKYGEGHPDELLKKRPGRKAMAANQSFNDTFDGDNSLLAHLDLESYDLVNGLEAYNALDEEEILSSQNSRYLHNGELVCSQASVGSSQRKGASSPTPCKVIPMQLNTNMTPQAVHQRVNPGDALESGSLQDRLRRALSNNAKSSTTPGRLEQLHQQQLEIALAEAEAIRHDTSQSDVGPFYGLPSSVKELLEKERGIKKVYDWQHECLTLDAVKKNQNLIYSLPTSGGKTLVAEILILREVIRKKRNCLFVLPYVAIVQEKVKSLTPFAAELDFAVEEYAGARGQIPPRRRRRRNAVYICTIEKANSLVNSLIELKRLDELGLIVVDELHMLGEGGGRGAILEMTLAKVMHVAESTQIVGMSATLNNISDLSKFLNAYVYSNDFRPVELTEYVKIEDMIFRVNSKALCPDDKLQHERIVSFKREDQEKRIDPDHLTGLVKEVIPNHSCLIFCATKKNCENVAELLTKLLPSSLMEVKKPEKKALLSELWFDGNGTVCPVLKRTIPFGIAYHHSGLTSDERRLIEDAYLAGTLCLITCTSTLAAGVNLPAKRVILRSPYIARDFLTRSRYKQMVGRAGRAGLDSSGESILILQKKDRLKMLDLISGPCDVCKSSLLYEDNKGMRALLLTTIGLQITPSRTSLREFLERTLCQVQAKQEAEDIVQKAQGALQTLLDNQLVQERAPGTCSITPSQKILPDLEVTLLGKATFKGPIDVDLGPKLYEDLCAARESLVLSNHLHLLYLVTPYDMATQVRPEWMTYLEEMGSLDEHELNVAATIGVPESYIAKKASGQYTRKAVDETVVARFYLALMLYRLWNQKTIWEVARRFQQPRGFIQNLLNGAAAFASCVSHYCKELPEFWAFQDLFSSFVTKLSNCFVLELLPLLEVPGVKLGRARQLFKAGYKNLRQVAFAKPEELVKSVEHLAKKTAVEIIAAAKLQLQEQAEALQEEADEIITMPTDMPLVAMEMEVETVQTGDSQFSGVDLNWDESLGPI